MSAHQISSSPATFLHHLLILFLLIISPQLAFAQEEKTAPRDSAALLKEREELDRTIWVDEVAAQEYETVIVDLWDRLRNEYGPSKLTTLANFKFTEKITIGSVGIAEELELGIKQANFKKDKKQTFDPATWRDFVLSFEKEGIEIVQTEWHHSRFIPKTDKTAPKSTISFAIHAKHKKTEELFAFKGDLEIQWSASKSDPQTEPPVPASISVTKLKMQQRSKGGAIDKIWDAHHGREDWISAYPIMTYDLNGDGLSEIIIPRWNRIYWNRGGRKFVWDDFLDHPIDIWEAAILSDFNADGHTDFITVGKDGSPYFFAGTEKGKFPTPGKKCADIHFDMPTAITAGDADGDGDLDLWMTQYKLSFLNGQMPTPYYNANDGFPSFFLENDGNGSFTDITEAAGLAPLRHRRTYSASLIDLDADGDLDLMNVSDYAGLDIYENTGKGRFKLATEEYVDNRHFFGMGHTFGDYNGDGQLDFYVIGMSSTTARRLDRLKLGREDRPDIHPMRKPMGYGNRLYFGNSEKKFQEDPTIGPAVARTGWSWGATSFDFDLDGDQDIYVANGHRSGESCKDYCSTFWRHDIYTGDSKASPLVLEVFQDTLSDLNQDKVSWNGFEKNVLFVNHQKRPERFVNASFLFGAAHAYDARCVISDDLDGDGRPDLIIAESKWNGRGSKLIIRAFGNNIELDQNKKWVNIRLKESAGPGFSPNGAKVSITDNLGNVQTRWIVTGDSFLAQHAPTAHFGLGDAKEISSIEVTWPNGKVETHKDLSASNATLTLSAGTLTEPSQ